MHVCPSTYFHTGMLTPVVWKCPRFEKQCTFHLWQEHEAEAKKYHKATECSVPRTPTKADIRPYLEETPSTKLNRERVAKDITNRYDDDDTNEGKGAFKTAQVGRTADITFRASDQSQATIYSLTFRPQIDQAETRGYIAPNP
jgi:hypothetical protein